MNKLIIQNCGFKDICDCKSVPDKFCTMKRIARLCEEDNTELTKEILEILDPIKV